MIGKRQQRGQEVRSNVPQEMITLLFMMRQALACITGPVMTIVDSHLDSLYKSRYVKGRISGVEAHCLTYRGLVKTKNERGQTEYIHMTSTIGTGDKAKAKWVVNRGDDVTEKVD